MNLAQTIMRANLILLSLAFLVGCSGDDITGPTEPVHGLLPAPEGEVRVLVSIVDGEGQPFRPDQAWWYYTPNEQGQADKYETRCVNSNCMRYAVTGAAEGRVYVAASYRREHSDSHCLFLAYDALPVEVVAEAVPEVTLRMEEHLACE